MTSPFQLALVIGFVLVFSYFVMAGANTFERDDTDIKGTGWGQFSLFVTGALGVAALSFRQVLHPASGVVAAAILLGGLALYEWARRTIRNRRFHIAWGNVVPDAVCASGPYAFVRHPVYLSYMLAFLAVPIAFPRIAALAILLFNVALYLHAARDDERSLAASPLWDAYKPYRERTGMFFPRLHGAEPGRALAIVTALTAWAALALQLGIVITDMGLGGGLWRFLGYFTVLTNLLVALVATAIALGGTSGIAGPCMRLTAVNSIVLVGLVYTVALSALQDLHGWPEVANVLLHEVTPLLFLAAWLSGPHGALDRWAVLAALAWPLAYFAYALVRGAGDGWYAYWFLNPATQSAGELVLSVAVLVCAFAAGATALLYIDRWLARPLDRVPTG